MTTLEYFCWQWYYQENPFGEYRKDLSNALTCQVMLAPYSKRETQLNDFMIVAEEVMEEDPKKLVNKVQALLGTAEKHKV